MRVHVAFTPDEAASAPIGIVGPPGLEEDIRYCAHVSVLDVVPRFAGMRGTAAEIAAQEVSSR